MGFTVDFLGYLYPANHGRSRTSPGPGNEFFHPYPIALNQRLDRSVEPVTHPAR